ncbi:MAG: phage tail protein [Dehalococcoidia bacterium]
MADAPFTGQFLFSIDGIEIGAFMEVRGLAVEVDVQTIEEGGQNEFTHRVPGRMKWPNLVLKRAVTVNDEALFGWFRDSSGDGFAAKGHRLARRTGHLTLVDAQRNRLREWAFYEAFPVKWTGPTFSAASNSVATEELEIAHHGFRVN